MNFLLTGDWHVHNYSYFSKPWREGLNTRARDIYLSISEGLAAAVRTYKPKVLVSFGDWNQNASNDYRLVDLTMKLIRGVTEKGIEKALGITGNHDTVSSNPNSYNISPYIRPMGESALIDGIRFWNCGYNNPLPPIDSVVKAPGTRLHVFLLHKDIEGGAASSGFIYKSRNEVKVSQLLAYVEALTGECMFLAGHYHQSQMIGKIVRVVGAPVQHNRGDSGKKRGVGILNSEGGFKFQELPGPRFVSIDFDEDGLPEEVGKLDYLTIEASSKFREIQEWAKDIGANIWINEKREEKTVVTADSVVKKLEELNDSELLDMWLQKRDPDISPARRAKLVKIAESL